MNLSRRREWVLQMPHLERYLLSVLGAFLCNLLEQDAWLPVSARVMYDNEIELETDGGVSKSAFASGVPARVCVGKAGVPLKTGLRWLFQSLRCPSRIFRLRLGIQWR